MKNIFTLLILLIFILKLEAQEKKEFYENGEIKSIENYSNKKLNGITKKYYEGGQIAEISNYVNGKLSGSFKEYYKSGKISSIGTFKNGLPLEIKSYYENENLRGVANYKNGGLDGIIKTYYENGQQKNEISYKNGKPFGKSTMYFENGKIYGIVNFDDNGEKGSAESYYQSGVLKSKSVFSFDNLSSGYRTEYFENKNLKSHSILVNGKKNGEYFANFKNGKKHKTGFYKEDNKDSLWTTYDENGMKIKISNYKKGILNGKSISYYKNNSIKSEGNYQESFKIGEWKFYYPNSKIESIIEYLGEPLEVKERGYTTREDNREIKHGYSRLYRKNGELSLEGAYRNNEAVGTFKSYFENGNIAVILLYEKGKLMEIISMHDINGNKLDKGTLTEGNGTMNIYTKDGEFMFEKEYKNGIEIED